MGGEIPPLVTDGELMMASGLPVPCVWPPTPATRAGAQSKAGPWYYQMMLQGDNLLHRCPPPSARTATGVEGPSTAGGVDRPEPSLTDYLAGIASDSLGDFMGRPPPPKAGTCVAACKPAMRRRKSTRKPAMRRRASWRDSKALSRMYHMAAVRQLRCAEKAFKALVEKLQLRRLKHMEPLGFRLNMIVRHRILAVARSRGIPGA